MTTLFALMLSPASAGPPPGVDLDDIAHWERAAETILDGPAGCWEMVGQVSWEWDVGRWGASRGDAMFVGRLEDGVWSQMVVQSLGEMVRDGKRGEEVRLYGEEPRFAPLVGKLEGRRVRTVADRLDDSEITTRPENVLRNALDRLGTDVESSWAQWDDAAGAVVLHRALPLNDGNGAPEARVEVSFPAGQDVPVSLDVTFPERFHKGFLPRWRIEDAVVHVRGRASGGKVFPTLETFKFEFGLLGFSATGAQTIRYKSARRCPDPAAVKAAAASEPGLHVETVGATPPE